MASVDITISVPAGAAQALQANADRHGLPLARYLSRAMIRALIQDDMRLHRTWLAQVAHEWEQEALLDEVEQAITREIEAGTLSSPESISRRAEELLAAAEPSLPHLTGPEPAGNTVTATTADAAH